ncbi:MAG: VOC family protein, partial [Trueperaceae bacterium]
ELAPTHGFLTGVLNLETLRTYPNHEAPEHTVHVYGMNAEGPAAEVHVAVRPDLPRARYGSGGVHHVALRIPDYEQYHRWTERLEETGMAFSGEVDRFYFRSLYIREPGGILFELATDGPGFHHDEPLETMGQTLALPPFLEPHRAQIEPQLRRL